MKKLAIVLFIAFILLSVPCVSASNQVSNDANSAVIGTDGAVNALFQDKNVNDKIINSFNNNEDFKNIVIKLNDAGVFDSSNLFPAISLDLDFDLFSLDFF